MNFALSLACVASQHRSQHLLSGVPATQRRAPNMYPASEGSYEVGRGDALRSARVAERSDHTLDDVVASQKHAKYRRTARTCGGGVGESIWQMPCVYLRTHHYYYLPSVAKTKIAMQAIWDLVGQWSSTEVRLSESVPRSPPTESTGTTGSASLRGSRPNIPERGARKPSTGEHGARQCGKTTRPSHRVTYQSRLGAVAEAVRLCRGGTTRPLHRRWPWRGTAESRMSFPANVKRSERSLKRPMPIVACEKAVEVARGQLRLSENKRTIETQMAEIQIHPETDQKKK